VADIAKRSLVNHADVSESAGCNAHDGSRSTGMLLFGESHAAGTASLASAGPVRALQSALDKIAVRRAHWDVPCRQSRRRDDALAKISTAPSDSTFPFSEYHPGLPFSPFSPVKTPPLTSASTKRVKLPAPSAAGHDTTVVHFPSKGRALCARALSIIARAANTVMVRISERMLAPVL
jgi:hypothetical protein